MPECESFVAEEVNNDAYINRHGALMFDQGFSFSGFERDKLWIKEGGRYFDASVVSGADDDNDGRAVVVADFDDDGDPDYFLLNTQRNRHRLFRNDVGSESGGFVKIRLRGTRGHAEAAGAVVRAHFGDRDLAKILSFGSGFLSQNAPELIFGIGRADYAEITVQWPGRASESFGRLKRGGSFLLTEGAGSAKPIALQPFSFPDPGVPGVSVEPGDSLESLAVVDVTGAPSRIPVVAPAGNPDRRLVIHFWATYCATCVAELPALETIHALPDVDVILVSMDQEGDRPLAQQRVGERAPSLPQSYATDELVTALLDPAKMPLPTTLVVGPDGRIEEIIQGPIDEWSGYPSR